MELLSSSFIMPRIMSLQNRVEVVVVTFTLWSTADALSCKQKSGTGRLCKAMSASSNRSSRIQPMMIELGYPAGVKLALLRNLKSAI